MADPVSTLVVRKFILIADQEVISIVYFQFVDFALYTDDFAQKWEKTANCKPRISIDLPNCNLCILPSFTYEKLGKYEKYSKAWIKWIKFSMNDYDLMIIILLESLESMILGN